MGYYVECVTPTVELLIFSILTVLCAYFFVNRGKHKLPPGPTGLPILGYLPFLGNDPAGKLIKLSKKYGDIFSLYLGTKYVVVVTDAIKAKELLSKPSLSDRPTDLFYLLPGGAGFGDSNGSKWTEQRRYSIKEMKNLGLGGSNWEKLLEEEVRDFIDILEKTEGKPIDIYKELSASISNNILTLVSGKRLPFGHPKRNILDDGIESFELTNTQSGLASTFPRLFKFCVHLGLVDGRQQLKDMQNMSNCLREQIEDLKHKEDGDSFIHKYLTEIEKNKQLNLKNSFDADMLLGNVQALVIAGSDTTKVSLLWLFLAMASFPQIQKKVQEEVDTVIGKDGNVNWIDRNKLPYCYATILEAQRWRSVNPLNVLRSTNEDVSIDGYTIPKKTNVLALIYAFHNDTRHWKDPEIFQPERFILEGEEKTKEPESYLPFSHGKRICPGKTVALIEIFHYFVAIMQKFRILPASENEQPDLVGKVGLTLQPKRQLLRYVLR